MSGSFYALNTKYNQLLALIQAGGGGGSQDLEQVLTVGNDANGLSITGVNNIDLTTINGSAYPPVVTTPNLEQVLTVGNDANGLSITGVNNIDLSTINGSAYPPAPIVPTLANVLLAGNSAGATDIDLNDNTLLKCAEITSTADLLLNPAGSIDANGKTLNMTNGEIHNCPLVHSQNNNDITIEAKGTGNVVLKTDNVDKIVVNNTTTTLNHTLTLDDPTTTGDITLNGSNQIATFKNNSTAPTSQLVLSANSAFATGVDNFTANPPLPVSQFTSQMGSGSINSQLITTNGGLLYQTIAQLYQDGDNINNTFAVQPTLQLYRYDNGNAGNYTKETKYQVNGITHTDTTTDPFTISTNQNLIMTADNIDISPTLLTFPTLATPNFVRLGGGSGKYYSENGGAGGLNQPQIELLNTNSSATISTGIPSIQTYKSGRNAQAGGDIISQQSFYAKDATGTKTEFGRIQVKTENVSAGNQDATMSFFCAVNGTNSEVLNLNGGQNEINTFRPLDTNGNSIRSSTGTLPIDATTLNFQNTSTQTSPVLNNIVFYARQNGVQGTNWLKVQLNGSFIWIPYLTADPNV